MIGPSGFMQAPKVPAERAAYGTSLIRCSKRKCSWRGFEGDLVAVADGADPRLMINVCPACGCDSYYVMTPGEIAAWNRKKAAE